MLHLACMGHKEQFTSPSISATLPLFHPQHSCGHSKSLLASKPPSLGQCVLSPTLNSSIPWLLFNLKKKLSWSIVDLQCSVSFSCTEK